MAPKPAATSRRPRGHVRRRGNSYQVLVYAGTDPVTDKPRYLTKSTRDERAVDRITRKLITEVDNDATPRRT
jgi:integrase